MNNADSLFLIANIDAETTLNKPANWVTSTDVPYSRADPIDIPELLDELFQIYKRTYEKLGTHIKEKADFFEHNRWILVRNEQKKLVAFIVFKTTDWGLKLIVCGSDGSDKGKNSMISLLIKTLNVKGVYGEVSPPLEMKLCDNVPKVLASRAVKVLNKEVVVQDDNYHYIRVIKNIGAHKKLFVGRPSLMVR